MSETWFWFAIVVWGSVVAIPAIVVLLTVIFGKPVKAPIEEREPQNGPRIISIVRQGNETLISVEHNGEILVMRFFTTWSNPVEEWKKQLGV